MGGASRPLDLVFMGTPDFAAAILAALLESRHRVVAVYSQKPRPAGRGHRVQPSPVQRLAEARGLPVCCPDSLREPAAQAAFAALGADAAVVAAYGLILPPAMLEAPRLGCLNVHASLLPRWRGAAPVQRALLAGDSATGVSIMRMDEGLDTGPVLLQRSLPIAPGSTAGSLTRELAALGGQLIVEALDAIDILDARPQPESGATYARKLDRGEARLDWRLPAAALERRVRAFDPWPGAWFVAGEERIRVLAAALAGAARHGARRAADGRLRRGRAAPVAAAAAGAQPARRRRAAPRLCPAARDAPAVPRYRLVIEYDGGGFVGWQRQKTGLSVQGVVEAAIARFC